MQHFVRHASTQLSRAIAAFHSTDRRGRRRGGYEQIFPTSRGRAGRSSPRKCRRFESLQKLFLPAVTAWATVYCRSPKSNLPFRRMSELIIGGGELPAKRGIALATKSGKPIPNEQRLERAPAARIAAVELIKQLFPSAKFRSISALYNCVGHVFGGRRTCIDPSHLPQILYEDDYRKLSGDIELHEGDIVVYRDERNEPTHVGVVFSKEPDVASATWRVTVLSKWGADAEYLHGLLDVPTLYGSPEFWSERKQPNDDWSAI